ncbi:hypothetical protein [Deinococcus humi]|uniref:Uncharacterized protein n=1 Tax=Deinococcus humi TaxID=662880 RepID=A0A7W8JZL4_9DEIO|nr:hypothetical protein [Deinococcus humi]MBB5364524.1 hypothetical protein [Deinococcus humi]GGO38026.1 hypothetical protein GCM10008949_44040 [Deinococcus humi]
MDGQQKTDLYLTALALRTKNKVIRVISSGNTPEEMTRITSANESHHILDLSPDLTERAVDDLYAPLTEKRDTFGPFICGSRVPSAVGPSKVVGYFWAEI